MERLSSQTGDTTVPVSADNTGWSPRETIPRDLIAGLVVFLVALPLCLGVALASDAPLFSGLIAGIVGGVVVGMISGSQTSVSGPAAGLTAIVSFQIATLGSFDAFLLAVFLAGVMQVGLGVARAGFIAAFFPSSVIKGLLASIGVILILKQIPHVFGHDADPEGDMSFIQPDNENTFTELFRTIFDIHVGAAVIGLLSVMLLLAWDRFPKLKQSLVPAPLLVVILGIGLGQFFALVGGVWPIQDKHMVQVPVAQSVAAFADLIQFPDFSAWSNPLIYKAAITIALVASLETLLNLEAVDNIDSFKRKSPPSRELVAQGVGNMTSGLLGGIPITSVIIRGSVNINAGNRTNLSTIVHGVLLLVSVALLPNLLNQIPLSCLAAILLVTGYKLASPRLVRQMYAEGRYQFVPFIVTVVAIVLTDLLIGILIGMAVAISFILNSNFRRPLNQSIEKHLSGDVIRIELANQVSFLNRAALDQTLNKIPRGGDVLISATYTDYIDPDVLEMIRDFKSNIAPARGVRVSLKGFRTKYKLADQILYSEYATPEIQASVTPKQVLRMLKEGHRRFVTGQRLDRVMSQQLKLTEAQSPLAVVLSCIDSRAPTELVFDLGLGDVFSVRVAGNVPSQNVLGSIEYACEVAKAKLILVMGHTRCGAVTAAVDLANVDRPLAEVTGCQNIEKILSEIKLAVGSADLQVISELSSEERLALVDDVARRNVMRTVQELPVLSTTIRRLVDNGSIEIVGAMYDVITRRIRFITDAGDELESGAFATDDYA